MSYDRIPGGPRGKHFRPFSVPEQEEVDERRVCGQCKAKDGVQGERHDGGSEVAVGAKLTSAFIYRTSSVSIRTTASRLTFSVKHFILRTSGLSLSPDL
jgi:hypothetical protein